MFKAVILTVFIGLVFFTSGVVSSRFERSINQNVYNLFPFYHHRSYEVSYRYFLENNDVKQILDLSFSFPKPQTPSCADPKLMTFATYHMESGDKKCIHLSKTEPTFAMLNPENATEGFKVTFEKDAESAYSLQINLHCDKTVAKEAKTQFKASGKGTGLITLDANSPYGCPAFSLQEFGELVEKYKWIISGVLALLGLFLLLLGLHMFKYAIFIIGTLVGTGAMAGVFFSLSASDTSRELYYAIGGVSLLVGLTAGYFAYKYKKFGFLGMGIALGIVAGFFLCSSVLASVVEARPWVTWVVVVVCAIIAGFLVFYLRKNITIIATSVVGAYLIVRGISVLWHDFPSEIGMYAGERKVTWKGWVYFVFIIIFAILGTWFQHRQKRLKELEEKLKSGSVTTDHSITEPLNP